MQRTFIQRQSRLTSTSSIAFEGRTQAVEARTEGGRTPNGHACVPGHNASSLPFCDHTLPIAARVKDLLGRLSVEEKAHLIAIRGDSPDAGQDLPHLASWLKAHAAPDEPAAVGHRCSHRSCDRHRSCLSAELAFLSCV